MKQSAPAQEPAKRESPKVVLGNIQNLLDELPDAYDYAFRPGRILFFNYLKGIASSLGVLTVFAIIIPLTVLLLQSFQWGPITSQFINYVIQQVDEAKRH